MEDDRQKANLLKQVAELFSRDLSPMILALYLKCLKAYSAEEVQHAIEAHLNNPESGQFMPKPADIVKHLTGGTPTQALKAWTILDKAVKTIGPYMNVCFEDPFINQVIVDMGGWINFGTKTNAEWPFVENEFIKRYTGFLLSPATLPSLSKLIGAHDHTGGLNGMSISETRLIFCDTRAAQVLKQKNKSDLDEKLTHEGNHSWMHVTCSHA